MKDRYLLRKEIVNSLSRSIEKEQLKNKRKFQIKILVELINRPLSHQDQLTVESILNLGHLLSINSHIMGQLHLQDHLGMKGLSQAHHIKILVQRLQDKDPLLSHLM